jgi:hypothetical protein
MKKFFIILFSSFCLAAATKAQSVSVNTDGTTADASAILDVKSTTKGVLVPRVTTAQRTAIVSPASGLLVYDTDVKSFWYYNGTAWTNITGAGGGGSLTLPFDATVNTPGTALKIVNGTTAIEGSSLNNPGIYGYSENGSGISGNSTNGFGVFATSTQATAIRANSFNANPTVHSTNSNGTGTAIRGEASGVSGVGVFGTAASSTSYGVRGTNTVGTGIYGFSTSGHGVLASSNSGVGLRTSSTTGNALEVFGKLKIYGAAVNVQNGAVLTSDAEGNASWKMNRVAFKASNPGGSINDEQQTTAIFITEEYDYSNSFNIQTGGFTAPVTGVYNIGTRMVFTHLSEFFDLNDAYCVIMISRGGNLTTIYSPRGTIHDIDAFESQAAVSFSTDIKLQAGDIVWVRGYQSNGGGNPVIDWGGEFWGHLVFAE